VSRAGVSGLKQIIDVRGQGVVAGQENEYYNEHGKYDNGKQPEFFPLFQEIDELPEDTV
jgi:hypothetical protein